MLLRHAGQTSYATSKRPTIKQGIVCSSCSSGRTKIAALNWPCVGHDRVEFDRVRLGVVLCGVWVAGNDCWHPASSGAHQKTMTKCTRRMSYTQMSQMHLEMHNEGFGVGKLTG
jgi:hypothetical protein